VSGKQIKYTIYVRLSATKYVKVAHLGEDLTAERIELFKRKGIQYLYLSKEDFHQYLQFSLGLANAVKSSRQISKDKKAHFMRHTTEVLMEQLFHSEIDQTDLADAQSVVQNSVGYLIESPECFDLLSTLNTHADFVYAHSMGVSLYSSLMAKKVGWNTPSTLYKLSFAGLLHDIGLKFVDRQILVKSKGALTLEETRSFEGHSVRGMEALARVPSVSSDVLQIVLMHHERDLGTGYPSGLIKNKIHPLARLTAVADEFCSLVISAPEAPAIPPKQALERLSALYASSLDPGFLVALMKIFNVEPPANLLRDKQKV
jgi:HD-GYP domain-containing protein (c-di-GMP phosphodiesterase class II)